MAHLNGTMAKFLKENGKMELKMALEFGNHQKETFMKENGGLIANMEKEYSNIV
jgi:hypothetical protein